MGMVMMTSSIVRPARFALGPTITLTRPDCPLKWIWGLTYRGRFIGWPEEAMEYEASLNLPSGGTKDMTLSRSYRDSRTHGWKLTSSIMDGFVKESVMSGMPESLQLTKISPATSHVTISPLVSMLQS